MPDQKKDYIKYAKEVVGKDPLATYLGICVDEVKEGYAKVSIKVKSNHLNAVDMAHGGLIYAMADQAFAVASNSTGYRAVSVNFNINYIAPASLNEKIYADAVPLNIGKKVSVWKVHVRGEDDRLLASCQGLAYHK